MQDLILICSMSGIFVFGFWVMGKVDDWLEDEKKEKVTLHEAPNKLERLEKLERQGWIAPGFCDKIYHNPFTWR